jgi:hypothetical protein
VAATTTSRQATLEGRELSMGSVLRAVLCPYPASPPTPPFADPAPGVAIGADIADLPVVTKVRTPAEQRHHRRVSSLISAATAIRGRFVRASARPRCSAIQANQAGAWSPQSRGLRGGRPRYPARRGGSFELTRGTEPSGLGPSAPDVSAADGDPNPRFEHGPGFLTTTRVIRVRGGRRGQRVRPRRLLA